MTDRRRAWAAVATLAVGVFVVTVTEMVPVGLLSQLSGSLGVSESTAGWSVAAYGLVAGLAAPPLTRLTRSVDRRLLVLVIVGVFVGGNSATAGVSGIATLLAVRIAIGAVHGLMWSIIAAIAVRLVPWSSTTATAVVFSGISVALVLGVPLGTWLGQEVGWRWTFLALATAAAVSWIALAILVPPMPTQSTQRTPSTQPATPRTTSSADLLRTHRPLRMVLAITALLVIGNYAAYTYIVPFAHAGLGFVADQIAPLLLIYGVAGVVGNLLAGFALGRGTDSGRLMLGTTAALTVTLALLPLLRAAPPLAVLAVATWGLTYSALPVMLQTRIFAVVPADRETATSLYVLTFNLCIAAGAFLGGLALDQAAWLPVTLGAACTGLAVLLSATSRRPGHA